MIHPFVEEISICNAYRLRPVETQLIALIIVLDDSYGSMFF